MAFTEAKAIVPLNDLERRYSSYLFLARPPTSKTSRDRKYQFASSIPEIPFRRAQVMSRGNGRHLAFPNILLYVLAAGNFTVATGAFALIGLLVPIARFFETTVSLASIGIAVYAATYALLSPILVGITGRYSRRSVLLFAMSIFSLACFATALAPTFELMLIARVASAAGACLFTPVAASVAFSAVAPHRRGRALATVFLGLTISSALGVPIGTILGSTGHWQLVFVSLAIMAIGMAILIAVWLPSDVEFQRISVTMLVQAAGDWRPLIEVLVTAIFFIAMFIFYAFITPTVIDLKQLTDDGAGIAIFVYGIGSTLSAICAGRLIDRWGPLRIASLSIAVHGMILPFFSFLPLSLPVFCALLFAWAMSVPGFLVSQQNLVASRTPQRQTIMLALNATANYAGSAIGAALGALVVKYFGLEWLGICGAVFAGAALAGLWLSQGVNRRTR